MRLQLDTQVVLWWLDDSPRLGAEQRDLIEDAFNEVVVSAASIWEIAIKSRIGKLEVPDDLLTQLDVREVDVLDIRGEHAYSVRELPLHHRDPFDRLIVTHAREEGYTLVTSDVWLGVYYVPILAAA